jgi:hypothetical protein
MIEIWKEIKGYEGTYEVSNKGNIRTLKPRTNKKQGPKLLKPFKYTSSQTEYYRIELSNPSKKHLVHRLVAEAFIGKPVGKDYVNHLDNNGLNNNVDNLEWCTVSENLAHAQKQGRLFEAQSKGGKVTSKKAQESAHNFALSLVGTTINSWTAVYLEEKEPNGPEKLYCRCKCGYEQSILALRFSKGESTMCRQCASLVDKKSMYDNQSTKYVNSVIGTWYIFDVSPFDKTKPVRSTKFQGRCTVCKHTTTIPQPSVIGTKPIKCCPVCKDKAKLEDIV